MAFRGAAAVAIAVVMTGCTLPVAGPAEETIEPSEAPLGSDVPDPARDTLLLELEQLGATVTAAADALEPAATSDDPAAARAAADRALDILVATAGDAGGDPRPLFPGDTDDRGGGTDGADQLTRTMTAARDLGGTLGNQVLDLLRDPVAGDLGSWLRDATGVLASVRSTTEQASDLEGLEAAVSELPGLGTQAIAWTELTAAATELEAARAYAERGLASLEVITVSIDRLDTAGAGRGADSDDPTAAP